VLHDVFQLPFDQVGDIVGRSPAAVRKLASRARVHVREHGDTARFTVDAAEQTRVAERFIAAASGGDLEALLAVLDPDVAGEADLGDLPPPPGFPSTVTGRDVIAPRLIALFANEHVKLACLPVNGEPAVVASVGDRLLAVVVLTTRQGLVTEIHAIVDPHKLAHLQGASLAGPHPAAEDG
jgi:RNA polymerase sigma-70 factor, ECF subfamily